MSSLKVNGFGGLELHGNGLSIHHFPTHHVEELLGYLLLNQKKPCGRDSLIELLWRNEVSESVRGRLNTVLWRLRGLFRQLGFSAQSFLVSTRDLIVFDPTVPLQFDVDNFEHHLRAAYAAAEDTTKACELTKAIDLYQGDLYEGVFTDWCLVERERLARMHLQALGELMYCFVRQNAYQGAIEVGQTILNEDPLREEIHRVLIYCYGRLGYRAEAAAQFKLCTDNLMSELQVFPMPDTVVTYQQIMTRYLNNSRDTSKFDLLKEAYRAYADFQLAGEKLIKVLDKIDESKTIINS